MLIRAILAAIAIYVMVLVLPTAIQVAWSVWWTVIGLGLVLAVGAAIVFAVGVSVWENAKGVAGCLGFFALALLYALFVAHPVLALLGLVAIGVAVQMAAKKYAERQSSVASDEAHGSRTPPLPPIEPEQKA